MSAERARMDDPSANDPRIYMAAERTFLAWIRTGVALMGFGFVVARFGLFLRELTASGSTLPHPKHAVSIPIGVALLVLGIFVNGAAAVRHQRAIRALREGAFTAHFDSGLPILVAVVLALLGTAMAAYLALI